MLARRNNFKGYEAPESRQLTLDRVRWTRRRKNEMLLIGRQQPPLLPFEILQIDPRRTRQHYRPRRTIIAAGVQLGAHAHREAFLEILAGAAAHAILVGEGRK